MKTLKTWAAAAAMVALSGAAQAALIDRGGGLIYDTTRNITWLADMNYAHTSGHTGAGVEATGAMTWDAATAWADNLVYGGYSDWRLPTVNTADTTCSDSMIISGFPTQYWGYHCTGSELSGLFVSDFGNKPRESVLNQVGDTEVQIANLALFRNVQSYFYWASTVFVANPEGAWFFGSREGFQLNTFKTTPFFAVAVRPGDVATSVPEPQTLALALLALGATVVVHRRRSR